MRVVNKLEECVGFRLNRLGVRVWAAHCQLVAKDSQGLWTPIGSPRPLPLRIPDDPSEWESDTLLLTLRQYEEEQPGSDLRDLLERRKTIWDVLSESTRRHLIFAFSFLLPLTQVGPFTLT